MIGLSEAELEGIVAERCACFGTVKRLKIYLPQKNTLARSFALVDMATPEEAARLAAAAGQLTMDNAVVVFLQQEQLSSPALIRARNGGDHTGYPSLMLD